MLTSNIAVSGERVCYYEAARGPLTNAPIRMESHPEENFRRGVEQFNRREFFAAHETWEEIWLTAPEPEKTFLQGIIQVAAAFHHYQRGNRAGAQSLLEAGLRRLEPFPAGYRGLRLEALRAATRRWVAALAAGDDPGADALPQVEWAEGE